MSAFDGWNDPARPPPDDEDCNVLRQRVIHGRRGGPASPRADAGGAVSVESACFAGDCQVEEHRLDWGRFVVGWLSLPDECDVVKKEARGG